WADRLFRRQECHYRISLGGRPLRPTASDGCRIGRTPSRSDRCCRGRTVRTGGQGSDQHNTDRVYPRRGGGESWTVTQLNRPGGNITGVSIVGVEIAPKRLELAHQLVPNASTLAVLINSKFPMGFGGSARYAGRSALSWPADHCIGRQQ